MKKLTRGKVAGLVFAFFGLLGIVFGFVASYGPTQLIGSVEDLYRGIDSKAEQLWGEDVINYIKLAYIGGLITGFVGIFVFCAGVALFVIDSKKNIVWVVVVIISIILFIGTISSFVAQTQLNTESWVAEHIK